MQRKKIKQFNKQILCILILFVMIYTMFAFVPKFMNESQAVTYTYKHQSNDLPTNFETTYPGYKALLETLTKAHPNWTFKLYETNLEWEVVINNEYQGHGTSPSNLVPSNYSDAWICSICGKKGYDTTGRWYCASRGAIEYVMDPRNTLNDSNIFQYLLLSNDKNITKEQVATMAKKISYLNDQKLIDAIYEVANDPNYDINPFFIIGKILQEQGSGASALCSGQGYKNQYVGYYNLFNVGASGTGDDEVILNGLKYAQEQGWDTPQKAIMGGIGLIKSYINRGQDTLYYQKFNVTYKPYYKNQYAQNIFDSQSIGSILKGYYKEADLLDSEFIFEIPLYKNMPATIVKNPTVTSEKGELAYVNANGGLKLKDSPNGDTITIISEGTEILITERAKSKIGGYYWDKVSTPYGTGYMAREASDGSKTYLVLIKDKENNTGKEEKNYKTEGTSMIIAPTTTIKELSGATNSSKVFGTGAQIKLGDKTYNLVMLGDTSKDGSISALDYVKVKNKIMGTTTMDAVTEKAADVNRDGKVSATDYVKIRNHIMNVSKITL